MFLGARFANVVPVSDGDSVLFLQLFFRITSFVVFVLYFTFYSACLLHSLILFGAGRGKRALLKKFF